jgi:hypothetical protein
MGDLAGIMICSPLLVLNALCSSPPNRSGLLASSLHSARCFIAIEVNFLPFRKKKKVDVVAVLPEKKGQR